jgi:hypothetical protein
VHYAVALRISEITTSRKHYVARSDRRCARSISAPYSATRAPAPRWFLSYLGACAPVKEGSRRFTTPNIASADRMTKWGRFISQFHWSKTTEPLTPPSHDVLPLRERRAHRAEIDSSAPREEPRLPRSEMPSLERRPCPRRSVLFPKRIGRHDDCRSSDFAIASRFTALVIHAFSESSFSGGSPLA